MEIEKAKMMSLDMTQENIKKIQDIFPNAVTEVIDESGNAKLAIDFDVLKQELSDSLVSDKQERYQMIWPDKKQSILLANKSIVASLRPLKEKSIDFETTKNIYVEGDNLDALKLLRETYLNKIKMIYIDPPYNTGNDFVYNDDFVQSEKDYLDNSGQYDELGNKLVSNSEANGRFHTDWLNMMYPRLKVAKDFLRDDGVIFISIDDNELDNLRKMCDEIFGERNFVACVVIENDARVRSYDAVAITHEYIVMYKKSDEFKANVLEDPNKKFQYHDEFGGFDLYELRNRNSDFNINNRPNLYYPFYLNPANCNKNGLYEIDLEKHDGWVEVYPQESQGIKTVWRWGKDTAKQNLNTVLFGKKATNNWQIVKKYRESTYSLSSVWIGQEFLSDRGTLTLKKCFNNKRVFTFPKPIELIQQCLKLVCNSNDIVLDFFSGSASTAHAIMQHNIENNTSLNFIMIQLPELCDEKSEAFKYGYRTICEIGEERIKKAGSLIKEENKLIASNLDIGFRVFKLDSSNMNDVYYNPKAITQNLLEATIDNVKPDRNSLDLLFQVMLECGALLSSKIEEKEINDKKVYIVEDNYIAACFDDEVDDKTVEAIAKLKPIYACFKGSSFNSDSANINAEQIFKTYSPNTEKIKVI